MSFMKPAIQANEDLLSGIFRGNLIGQLFATSFLIQPASIVALAIIVRVERR
jgi:hypothetical protein